MTTTRDRLVDGMRQSLRARGFGNTSMKDMLTSTGVSSGSMYHSFPGGKDELAAAAVRDSGLHAAEQIAAVFAGADTVNRGIGMIFNALIAEVRENKFALGCPIGVPATEAVGVSERIQEASAEVLDAWTEAYAQALVNEGWEPTAATELATLIVITYEGSLTVARATKSTAPIEHALAFLLKHISSRRV
ncbi:MAG: TetR/AcrR family transcriptional regulator [Myxococcota bacterium]